MVSDDSGSGSGSGLTLSELATNRRQHASARATLRDAEDLWAKTRLHAEIACLARFGGDTKALGSNESDRRRTFDAAITADAAAQAALSAMRAAQLHLDKLTAEIDIATDHRRDRDLRLREAVLAALERGEDVATPTLTRAL